MAPSTTSAAADQSGLLHTLLANNHFDYFELDQVVQLDVLPL
jgi:hypothetical protein